MGEGGLAGILEIVVPDGGDGEVVVVPEFAFILSAIGGDGGIFGVDGVSLAVFVEEVGETDFEEDVVILEVLLEFLFMLDDGVLEGDTVWADNVGIDDEVILGFGIADGHSLVPDHFAIGWFVVHTGNNGGKQYNNYRNDTDDTKCSFHVTPSLYSRVSRDIFHLLL